MSFPHVIRTSWDFLLEGLAHTVELAAIVIACATALGLLVGFARAYRVPFLGLLSLGYVALFRAVPLPLQLLFIFFGAIYLGVHGLGVFVTAAIGMTLYEGAYIAEIFRSGVEAVAPGQREASKVLGLSSFSTNRDVVLPQAFPILRAPLFGQYIWLIKDTSLAVIIGFMGLIRTAQAVVERSGYPVELYAVMGVLYFIVCYPLSLFVNHLEKREAL